MCGIIISLRDWGLIWQLDKVAIYSWSTNLNGVRFMCVFVQDMGKGWTSCEPCCFSQQKSINKMLCVLDLEELCIWNKREKKSSAALFYFVQNCYFILWFLFTYSLPLDYSLSFILVLPPPTTTLYQDLKGLRDYDNDYLVFSICVAFTKWEMPFGVRSTYNMS